VIKYSCFGVLFCISSGRDALSPSATEKTPGAYRVMPVIITQEQQTSTSGFFRRCRKALKILFSESDGEAGK